VSNYETAAEETISALERIGLKALSPVGGYYIWIELPHNVDEIVLAKNAADKSIFIAPGTLVFISLM
jgi:DNA-binding transcriptional MocR family regulator